MWRRKTRKRKKKKEKMKGNVDENEMVGRKIVIKKKS